MIVTPVIPYPSSRAQELLQIFGASLFIAIMTQIQIFLPFTPIPLTGQTFAVMCVGALLGSRNGALSVLLYLMEGAMGLPVFTKAGFGIFHLLGPTGGYLVGFVAQAYLTGWFLERSEKSLKVLSAILLASCVQMGMGLLWLSNFVGWSPLLAMGLYPFIPGEILKAVALTSYLKRK